MNLQYSNQNIKIFRKADFTNMLSYHVGRYPQSTTFPVTSSFNAFHEHMRMNCKVLTSILKAHMAEARPLVRQVLGVLIPAVPLRMDDGHSVLANTLKRLLIEEGHSGALQLAHLLHILLRHFDIFYPVRHSLVALLLQALNRITLNAGVLPFCDTLIALHNSTPSLTI